MTLGSAAVVAFLATTNLESARRFYEDVLGLRFVAKEPGAALVFAVGDVDTLRITALPEHAPPPYTVLGWRVDSIGTALSELAENGVVFEFFDMLDQDEAGISTFPNGDRVAWFKDPSGNMLSINQSHI